jgi:hypothetical protein
LILEKRRRKRRFFIGHLLRPPAIALVRAAPDISLIV